MDSQQFHLKWNNHSLNTVSSLQHLFESSSLVDVTLTCSSGKSMSAHRMVLAACSDYFYKLFRDLPGKHPVVVLKDASEETLRNLLIFIYRGEVEVQEPHLNDFLKFANTLQIKGLTHGLKRLSPPNGQTSTHESLTKSSRQGHLNTNKVAKNPRKVPPPLVEAPNMTGDAAKSYLSTLSKFSPLMSLPCEPPGSTDFLAQLSSPNFYHALQLKNLEHPGFLNNMPFLKKMLADNMDQFGLASTSVGFQPPLHLTDEESDTPSDNPSPSMNKIPLDANEFEEPASSTSSPPINLDLPYSSKSKPESLGCNLVSSRQKHSQPRAKFCPQSKTKPSGRGSRLERMIAAEYKIMSEYSEPSSNENLPAMTPELMKSRRTHSLQLAIGEILHNRASVQSAATKYHIPRETLRRHYQRYLKAIGINKTSRPPSCENSDSIQATSPPVSNIHSVNGDSNSQEIEKPLGFSTLMELGKAYGIWNTGTFKPSDESEDKKENPKDDDGQPINENDEPGDSEEVEIGKPTLVPMEISNNERLSKD